MIIKNKNTLRFGSGSKILLLGLILIMLVGLFPIAKIQAAVGDACTTSSGQPGTIQDRGLYANPRFQCVATTQERPGDTCTTNGQPGTIQDRGLYANPRFQCVAATQAPAPVTQNTNYQLLAPLPCDPASNPPTPGCNPSTKTIDTFDPAQPNNIGAYLNLMIKIFIGLCAVLSVVMIVVGGIEYMTSELVSTKEAAKERIRNAIFGLILALGAYALLYTINPDLLKSDINPPSTATPTPTRP